jgi:hypothetical protein
MYGGHSDSDRYILRINYVELMFVCLFVCFHGRPQQAKDAGLFYRLLWTFQLWPPGAPAPTDAFCTLAAEVGTYGRE